MKINKLCFGDCFGIMNHIDEGRETIPNNSIDLICLDPPFNSKDIYNMTFAKGEKKKGAQFAAFTDTWKWGGKGTDDVYDIEKSIAHPAYNSIKGIHIALGDIGMTAYLGYMAKRIAVMRDKLKETGNIYLHCDPTASHYLKIVMDDVFNVNNFRNEIIWCYNTGGRTNKHFCKKHDTILFYSKSNNYYFNSPKTDKRLSNSHYTNVDEDGRRYSEGPRVPGGKIYRYYEDEGSYLNDWWSDITALGPTAKERTGYPTQKPIPLLERIIKSSCPPNGIVLDPFCGCGTTIAAAELLQRNWIGIDISASTIKIVTKTRKELRDKNNFDLIGIPEGIEEAKKLAETDRFQYEHWAISTIPGFVPNDKKNREGFDGIGQFEEPAGNNKKKSTIETITCEVKSSKNGFTAAQRNHFKQHVLNNESKMGVLLTLGRDKATEEWCKKQTDKYYKLPGKAKEYPKFQVFSAEHYFEGLQPDLPPMLNPITGNQVQDELFVS